MNAYLNSLKTLFVLILAFVSVTSLAQTITFQGKVVRVIDGDTVVLQDAIGALHTLRLAGIDAPEKKMPYGVEATAQLSLWLAGQEVIALTNNQDKYGRKVATLFLQGQDINLAMVQNGLAWHYIRYAPDQPLQEAAAYSNEEQIARTHQLGLWGESMPIAPWNWRYVTKRISKNISTFNINQHLGYKNTASE